MSTAIPDLSAPLWTGQLAGLLEQASLAVGRLDARVSATPVARAWFERASWTGFAEARRGQGGEIDEIDIFALACDAPMPGRAPLAFAADEAEALARWQRELARRDSPHWRELIPASLDLPDDWRARPALLRALELTARHAPAPIAARQRGWSMPMLLKALGVTHTPLPCLVVADKALRLAPRDREAIVPRYLKALARNAEAGLARLEAIEADRLRAAAVIARLHRPGALPALMALLQRRPALRPLAVARLLGLTISGAGKLLSRAAADGLVVEISGRQAWRTYLTPDLAAAFGFVARPIGRPPALPAAAPLEPVLAQFDLEMAAIDARLAELGARG